MINDGYDYSRIAADHCIFLIKSEQFKSMG